ncbi:MarR family transcriptional regulator [Sporosarcina ureilytica]|uniref:HTH marR-type domain-containing protein n=1 Tax=Sporosarcina ureilytica TaxID=298596 RepID=A0A1D8JGR8_9BACL|nr:helix-turn-helix domain-containing protein [Sporosarcina ureilytica]AOV07907.1 hypothetical protein BI350_10405 [Sporosarcina ureilytica]
MQQARNVDHPALSDTVGREALSDLIHTIIDNIIVHDKRVLSITFKNGITHNFAYKTLLDSKAAAPTRMQYRYYEDAVLNHLKDNGPTSRADLQKATNISRDGIFKLLAELMERRLVKRTGQSTLRAMNIKKNSPEIIISSEFFQEDEALVRLCSYAIVVLFTIPQPNV